MALVTLCPNCGATFKVYPEQLQIKNGLVRCGQCQVIFNGFATLITIDETEIEYPTAPGEKDGASGVSDKFKESVVELNSLRHETVEETDSGLSLGQAYNETVTIAGSTDYSKSVEKAECDRSAEDNLPKESGVQTSDFLAEVNIVKPRWYWLWNLGSVALLFVFIGQILYFYRADLTVLFPQARPHLEHLCGFVDCSVPLPENIQFLSIVSSDLEVRDPEHQPDVATLTVIIRNHATYAQALPTLKLFLTGMHNELLASRIVTAAEYLSGELESKAAIEPNQEIIIRLYLDNSQLKSAGYRLQLLYL